MYLCMHVCFSVHLSICPSVRLSWFSKVYERVERVIEEVGLQKAASSEDGKERESGVISGGEVSSPFIKSQCMLVKTIWITDCWIFGTWSVVAAQH